MTNPPPYPKGHIKFYVTQRYGRTDRIFLDSEQALKFKAYTDRTALLDRDIEFFEFWGCTFQEVPKP